MFVFFRYFPYIFFVGVTFVCLGYFYLQQHLIQTDTKLMRRFFSQKTWLLFCYGEQQKILKRLFFLCVIISTSMILVNAISIYFYFRPIWLEPNFPIGSVFFCVLTLLLWSLYFLFKFLNIDKFAFDFKETNPRPEFFYHYQLILGPNTKLFEAISNFIVQVNHLNTADKWLPIPDLLLSYLDLLKRMMKDKQITSLETDAAFVGNNTYLNFAEMLHTINDYFNNYDLEVKVLRSAKLTKL